MRSNPYFTVELWFRTTKGGTLFSYSQKPLELQDGGTAGVPVLYVGADGKLRGQFWNGTLDPITTNNAVNDGAWHHVVLTASGDNQRLYLDSSEIGSRSGAVINVDPVNTIGAGGANAAWPSRWENDPKGYFEGDIDDAALYARALSSGTVGQHWRAGQTASLLSKVTLPTGRVHSQVDYDTAQGRVSQVIDADGGVWKVSAPSFTGASTAYTQSVIGTSPRGYWRLGEKTGEWLPNAVNTTERAQQVKATLGAEGAFAPGDDTAAKFNGWSSWVHLPDNLLNNKTEFSVELWFNADGPGVLIGMAPVPLAGSGVNSPGTPMLYVGTDGKLRGELWHGSVNPITTGFSVLDGNWHHAVLTGDPSGQTLYLDGRRIGTGPAPMAIPDRYTTVGTGVMSTDWPARKEPGVLHPSAGPGYPTTVVAVIDEVAVYHRPLDEATVTEHFTAGTRPSAGVGAGYRAAVAAHGPQSYWRLNEATGNQVRSQQAVRVGNGDGTTRNVETVATGALPGENGAKFNGNAYVELPQDLIHGSSQSSVEMWFKTTQPGVLYAYQSHALEDTTQQDWIPALYVDLDGKLRGKFYTSVGMPQIITPGQVTDNQWHHVALTTDGQTHTMYLDGNAVGTAQGPVYHERALRNYVGAGTTGSWAQAPPGKGYFTGQIDEVAVYRHAIDAATVSAHAAARTAAPADYRTLIRAAGPVGHWPLDKLADGVARSLVPPTTTDEGAAWNTTHNAPGAFGPGDDTAKRFNGTNSYIKLPKDQLTGRQQFSAELWFKADGPGVLMGYSAAELEFTAADTPATPMLYVGRDGRLRGMVMNGTTDAITAPTVVLDGRWHHVVLTVDSPGNKQRLYLDSELVGERSAQVFYMDPHLTVGAGPVNNLAWPEKPTNIRGHFTGSIDEVALYGQALNPEAVAAHYAAKTEPTASALGATVQVTDPAGRVEERTYDVLNGMRLTALQDVAGGRTTFGYDTAGLVHTVTDPNGHATITGHDRYGNTVSRTTCRDQDSCWTSYTEYYRNPANDLDPRNGQPTAERDARSASPTDNTYKTTYTYTPSGHPLAVTAPGGFTTTRAYTDGTEPAVGGGTTPAGLLKSVTAPGGGVTAYTYFANGDLVAMRDAAGLRTEYQYDGIGRITSETQVSTVAAGTPGEALPAGSERRVTTTTVYDGLSRIVSRTGPGVKNEVTGTTHTTRDRRTYDGDGRTLTQTVEDLTGGSAPRTTTVEHDPQGRPWTITDAEGGITKILYDAFGRPVQQINALGTSTLFSYTPRGQLAETKLGAWKDDPASPPRDLVLESRAYDPAGRLASTTDAMGRTTAVRYYDDGLTAEVKQLGVRDVLGNPRDIVLQHNTYDGAGNLVRQVTGGTNTVERIVDPRGLVTSETLDPGGLGRRTDLAYDANGWLKTATSRGPGTTTTQVTELGYDALGRTVRETVKADTGDIVSTTQRDQRGLVLHSTTPRGNATGADPAAFTTSYRYDALGRVVAVVAPPVTISANSEQSSVSRPTSTLGYNAFGENSESTDAAGRTSKVRTDKLGRPVETELPAYTPPGATTPIVPVAHAAYDDLGRVFTQTDPLGKVTSFTYDKLDQLTERHNPARPGQGATTERWFYSPAGDLLATVDPSGARTEATYDELGRPVTQTEVERYPTPQQFTTRHSYDDAGNLVASTTPGGGTWHSTYNAAGEPLTQTDPLGRTQRADYDAFGQVTRTVDPSGVATGYTYDRLGQTVAIGEYDTAGALKATTGFTYDPDGNLTTRTDARGGSSTYAYDALGLPTQLTEKVSATEQITTRFGYNATGQRTYLRDGRGNATNYTYNTWGLPESTIEPATTAHPNAADRTWTNTYDAASNTVRMTAPDGVVRDRTYTPLGELLQETGTGGGTTTEPKAFTYDLAGRIATASSPGGPANTYGWNDRGLMTSQAGPAGNATYAYDAEGRLTGRTDAAGTATFGYNQASQLTQAVDPITGLTVAYGYDAAGRPDYETYNGSPGDARRYSYDNQGRLSAINQTANNSPLASIQYEYTPDHLVAKKTTTGTAGAAVNTYGYDLADRMTSWNDGTKTTAYAWDASGNRTLNGDRTATYDERNRLLTDGPDTYSYTARGTLASSNIAGTVRQLQFDAFDRLAGDTGVTYSYDAFDRVAARGTGGFAYDGMSNDLVSDGSGQFSRLPDGSLLGLRQAGQNHLAWTDEHGDLVALLGADGKTIAGSRAYDPFGKPTAQQGQNSTLGYQGAWTDPETGELNMHARWYTPSTGNFASRDDWLLTPDPSIQANRYTYVSGQPMGSADPSGHCAKKTAKKVKKVKKVTKVAKFRSGLWGLAAAVLTEIVIEYVCDDGGSSGGGESPQYTGDADMAYAASAANGCYWCVFPTPNPAPTAGYPGPSGPGVPGSPASPKAPPGPRGPSNTPKNPGGRPPTKPKPPVQPKPPHRPTAPTNRQPTPATPVVNQAAAVAAMIRAGMRVGPVLQTLGDVLGSSTTYTPPTETDVDQTLQDLIDDEFTTPEVEAALQTMMDAPWKPDDLEEDDDSWCDSAPSKDGKSNNRIYMPRQKMGTRETEGDCRATGIYAELSGDDYGTGKSAGFRPPGFGRLKTLEGSAARGHLLAKMLGGPRSDPRNYVPQTTKTNSGWLNNTIEKPTRDQLQAWKTAGSTDTLKLVVVPIYGDSYGSDRGIPDKMFYADIRDNSIRMCIVENSRNAPAPNCVTKPVPAQPADGGT
ncbi:LamG domain-containing protein [Streptomycetaceae bacterium NBC_01309]